MIAESNDIILPPEFSGHAQLILFTRYGDPREPGWEGKWISKWKVQQLHPWFPCEEMMIHKDFKVVMRDALLELEKLGLHREIVSCQCSYQLSCMPDSPVLSVHSWGAAIDFNTETNPLGSLGMWSDEFINIMTSHGIHCGQNWTGLKDPAHFAMVDG